MISPTQLLAFRGKVQTQLESLLPCTITIDGVDYAAAGGTIDQQGSENGMGGQIIDTMIRFRVRKSLFSGTPPEPDTLVTYQSKEYRLDHVVDGTTDPAYVLTCEQVVKGGN